jgi:hypothetical protein
VPRGGKRQGTVGTAYSNRSDLNAPKPPALVPVGGPYGERKNLVEAQQAVPIAPPPPGGAPVAPIGPQAAPGGPVEPPAFHRPTERPQEPLTHGLPSGPGGGPEVLGGMAPTQNLGQLLTLVASGQGVSPDVKALAQWMQSQPR